MRPDRDNPLADDLIRPLLAHLRFRSSWPDGGVVLLAFFAWLTQAAEGLGISGPALAGLLGLLHHELRLLDRHQPRGHADLGHPPAGQRRLAPSGHALRRGHHGLRADDRRARFPIIHLGRPWLFFWVAPYPSEREIWPNFRSPLVWDFFAINTYLTGSLLFLFLPMIPDFAIVRDRSTGWRRRVYGALALGWRARPSSGTGSKPPCRSWPIAIVPVAVSVHTIVSFDFSMAPVPMWHSTIFGPYFVAGRDLQRHRGAHHRHGRPAPGRCTWRRTCTRCTSTTWASCCC